MSESGVKLTEFQTQVLFTLYDYDGGNIWGVAEIVFGERFWKNRRGRAGMITSVGNAACRLQEKELIWLIDPRGEHDFHDLALRDEGRQWVERYRASSSPVEEKLL